MKVPPRRVVKGLKEPASHSAVYTLVCGGIDKIANDRDVSPDRVRAELRALQRKCSNHLTDMLAEAVTGKEPTRRGLRVRCKKHA